METNAQQRTQHYISERVRHPAWLVLASRRAPLVLGCLQTLFEQTHDGIAMDEALQSLASMLASYADNDDYDINPETTPQQAGREQNCLHIPKSMGLMLFAICQRKL